MKRNPKFIIDADDRLAIYEEAFEIYKNFRGKALRKFKYGIYPKSQGINYSICECIVRSQTFEAVRGSNYYVDLHDIHLYFPELLKYKPHRKLYSWEYWWAKDCTKETRNIIFGKMINDVKEKINARQNSK